MWYMCEIFVVAWFADTKSLLIRIPQSRQHSADNIVDFEQAANQQYVDAAAEHAVVAVASRIAVVARVVEAVDAYAAVAAISAFEAVSVVASDERFVVEHSSDSTVYIAAAGVSAAAAVVSAAVAVASVAVVVVSAAIPVEIEAEPEHFAESNIVENLHLNSAGRAEDIVAAVAADIAAVFVVGIVFAVLAEVARLTFAVGLSVVAGPTEPVALANYVAELVEQLPVIAVAEQAFEFVVIASELYFASAY